MHTLVVSNTLAVLHLYHFLWIEKQLGDCESSNLETIVYPYKEAVEFYSPAVSHAVKNRSSHLQHHLHHHSQQRPKKSQAKAPEYYISWSIQVQPADIKY